MKEEKEQIKIISLFDVRFMSRITDSKDTFIHSHDFYEISYILSGKIKNTVLNNTYTLNAGDAFLIIPGVPHCFLRNENCTHRDILICKQLFEETCNFIDPNFFELISNKKYITFNLSDLEIQQFEKQYSIFLDMNDYDVNYNYAKSIVSNLLGIIYSSSHKTQVNSFKARCDSIIYECFSQQNALQTLREELCYTDAYLCKKFKDILNCTPTEYINSVRIANAASRLKTTNISIEECCYSVGFESISYFIKLFKKYYNITPAKYIKINSSKKTQKK